MPARRKLKYSNISPILLERFWDGIRCKNTFTRYPEAKCIVYDGEECDSDEWSIALSNGETQAFNQDKKYGTHIKSISVRHGCQLKLWKGKPKHIYEDVLA